MSCTVADRQRVREAAAELRACQGVLAVDTFGPGERPVRGWSLELVTTGPVSAVLLDRLARNRLAVSDVSPRGEHYETTAVV